jgi:ABC-type multidrug transport system fused ATPase/permease subunit
LVIIRAIVEVESNLTSCERILHYGSKIAIEPTITVDEFNPTKDITPTQVEEHAVHPAEDWPQAGAISFNNVSVSYRYDIEQPVLKHVQLDVIPGERIGIVGRTGAGKSTMLLCLFRFLECCQGNITIDDLDISKIPLHELRKRITIIPQSPALFSGTIRSNIDVFDEYDDHVIWQALERVHIKDKIEKMPLKLQEPVTEHGSNFSIGEQALISLSRSLLNKTKVIVFDEATAHVDHESDQLIQETIRNEFSDCTTLTIAHRLDTIIGSDRVIVLENGSIVEQGKPIDLLNASNGYFYGLCAENGPEYVASLKEMCKS